MSAMDDQDLKTLLEAHGAEARRHFEVVAERTDRKVEAIVEAVSLLGESVHGEIEHLEATMDGGFAETQAMIKFSHAELDRRVRVLEDSLSNLQTRVARLESTVH